MDGSSGNIRLADEYSPPEPEDTAADSELTAEDLLREKKGYHSEMPASVVGPIEAKPDSEPASVSADEASGAGGEREQGELEKPLR